MIRLMFMLSIVLFAIGCDPVAENTYEQKDFFDLKSFIEQQIEKGTKIKSYRKSLTFDGKTEQQILDDLNLSEELSIFTNADINKPAWFDKYEVDSVFNAKQQLVRLTYQTLDKKLKTKRLSVSYTGAQIDTVSIVQATANAVAKTDQHLIYIPEKGYRIENVQKVTALDGRTLVVDVEFVY
jgi:hypothetical protein